MLLAAEGHTLGFPLLTVMVLLPAAGAAVVGLIPRGRTELHRAAALFFAGGAGALSLYVLAAFERGEGGMQFEVDNVWIRSFGIHWHLGVDGISLFLVVLTGLLFPLAIAAVTPEHDPKPYYAWILMLEAGCLGVFVALDLFVFFIFFEIVLVPMYFLIGGWGHGRRVYAAMKFFLFTMLGSALMLVGILGLVFLNQDKVEESNQEQAAEIEQRLAQLQQQSQSQGLPIDQATIDQVQAEIDRLREPVPTNFDLVDIAEAQTVKDNDAGANPLDWTAARWIFLAFALAFAVKVPLFPLHTWLPDAHTEAPTAGSVILAAVMLKLGTYGFLRFGIYLFPQAALYFAPTLITLGVIGIIYGAVVATMQKDLKRLVAYSSVAHLGFIILGTFALTHQSVEGGVLQAVNHGLSTGALFLLVGMIYERRHTREIAALKGLQKSAPILAGVFTVVMLSSIGLPGLNGFVGEFLVLIGSFVTYRWWTVVAAAGVILAALYLLWAYQRVFHGEPDEDNAAMPDLTWKEGLAIAPLLIGIVFLGIYPKPVLDRIEPSVDALIAHVEKHTDYREPAVTKGGTTEDAKGEGK